MVFELILDVLLSMLLRVSYTNIICQSDEIAEAALAPVDTGTCGAGYTEVD